MAIAAAVSNWKRHTNQLVHCLLARSHIYILTIVVVLVGLNTAHGRIWRTGPLLRNPSVVRRRRRRMGFVDGTGKG